MTLEMITLYYNEDVAEEYGPINTEEDMEINFQDLLDESEPVMLLGQAYSPARVLKLVDPVMYRQAFLDYLDSWEEMEVPMIVYVNDDERQYILDHI